MKFFNLEILSRSRVGMKKPGHLTEKARDTNGGRGGPRRCYTREVSRNLGLKFYPRWGKGRLIGERHLDKNKGNRVDFVLVLRFVTQKSSPLTYLLGIDVESRDLG